jgi:hypothetical protein
MCCAFVITSGAGTSEMGSSSWRSDEPNGAIVPMRTSAEVVWIANDSALRATEGNQRTMYWSLKAAFIACEQ